MPDNTQFLIDKLLSLEALADRYTNIECIDDIHNRGAFSLVFKAWDTFEEKKVAIKFFSPERMSDPYRLECFRNEPAILKNLINKKRCLQLIEDIQEYTVNVNEEPHFEVTFYYFSMEWIDEKLDFYFEAQQDYDTVTKLRIFRNILLAVNALHRLEISHRDLKPDNLREYTEHLKQIIVAIDLGTSALYSSQPKIQSYPHQVGHRHYSSPESMCGLAGDRKIAFYTDFWALGCMLFELFSPNYFYNELIKGFFNQACSALAMKVSHATTIEELRIAYEKNVLEYKNVTIVPDFYSYGVSIPKSILDRLNNSLIMLTAFNYKDRTIDLDSVRRLIDNCITILCNENFQRRILEEKKRRRAIRNARAIQLDHRISKYSSRGHLIGIQND